MGGFAVIGNLTRDVVDGGEPRVGGAPYHAARALRLLGGRASVVARCAEADRPTLLPPLVALGLRVTWVRAGSTAAFALDYRGDARRVRIEEPGEPWTSEDVAGAAAAEWLQLGALTRADFPAGVLAALARRSRLALDGQGLVRPARPGLVRFDADFDPDVLRYVRVLKLAEDEAEVLGGEERVATLGVPEVLLTLGARGAVLLADGRREQVPVRRIGEDVDPTGAGDAFLAAYVWARALGHRPASAARQAASAAARTLELSRPGGGGATAA